MARWVAGVALATCLLVVLVIEAPGSRFAQPAAAVVTLDITRLLEGLQERADLDADVERFRKELIAEDAALRDEIVSLDEQMQASENADERAALKNEIDLKDARKRARAEFAKDRLDVEQSLVLRQLYKSIREGIEEMADVAEFDIVLMNDATPDHEPVAGLQVTRLAQVSQQIRLQRIFFARAWTDITDDLIVRMNNAYNTAEAP